MHRYELGQMLWRKTVQGYKSQERGPASNWRFTKTFGRVWGPGVGKKGGQGKGKRGGPDKGQELDLLKSLKRTDVAAVTWARKRGTEGPERPDHQSISGGISPGRLCLTPAVLAELLMAPLLTLRSLLVSVITVRSPYSQGMWRGLSTSWA